jgi:hypothetical protein
MAVTIPAMCSKHFSNDASEQEINAYKGQGYFSVLWL